MLTSTEYQQQLMDAFSFDKDDIEANRRGVISEKQISALGHSGSNFHALAIVCVLVTVGLVLALSGIDVTTLVPVIIMSFVIIGVVASVPLMKVGQISHDLQEEDLQSIEGDIQLSKSDRYGNVGLYIRNVHLSIAIWQTDVLHEGDRYLIYYLPHARRILAIEWLGAANTP